MASDSLFNSVFTGFSQILRIIIQITHENENQVFSKKNNSFQPEQIEKLQPIERIFEKITISSRFLLDKHTIFYFASDLLDRAASFLLVCMNLKKNNSIC